MTSERSHPSELFSPHNAYTRLLLSPSEMV